MPRKARRFFRLFGAWAGGRYGPAVGVNPPANQSHFPVSMLPVAGIERCQARPGPFFCQPGGPTRPRRGWLRKGTRGTEMSEDFE